MATISTSLTFECDVCNERHEIPLNLGFSIPDYVNKLLPWEREEKCKSSADWCIVEDRFFYLRGCLEVPIQGTDKIFSWGVWTTVSEDDFDATMDLWNDQARVDEPDYIGSLANSLPLYSETRNLPLAVRTRAIGDRPALNLQESSHPLCTEQREGMTMERAIELAKLVLHGQSTNPWSHLCER
ncbi:MAG TPA: DUF2199 domain-containing protein [Candidatus Obscuribacterales bacterium]